MERVGERFDDWYVRLHPRLVVALAAAFGDRDMAADATDEALVRACERWTTVSAMESPEGWVFTVAFNIAKRRLRRRALESKLTRRTATSAIDGPAGELWSVVAELPPRQRAAVVLRHVADLKEAEIAQVMGIARGTVSATLRDAYRSLRAQLEPELLEEPS
jgi:RNA polymerase sigma factor (sigma-70 family)